MAVTENLKWRVPLLLVFLVFASCADLGHGLGSPGQSPSPAPQKQAIRTVQPNDNQLTCDELLMQMGQMDQIGSASPNIGESKKNDSSVKGLVRAAVKQGIKSIPIVGSEITSVPIVGPALMPMIGPPSGKAGNAYQQQNRIIQAQQRKQHLKAIYDDKKCYARSPAPEQ